MSFPRIKSSKTVSLSKSTRSPVSALGLAIALLASSAVALPTLNPDVTQETVQQTICRPGYSASVRPSTRFTTPIKRRLMQEAEVVENDTQPWALDHKIAIALGGHPRALDNLQLLSATENSRKSRIEVKLLCFVCTGALPLAQAQEEVSADWQTTYRRYASVKCRR